MKCSECMAKREVANNGIENHPCKAGIYPMLLRSNKAGCYCNAKQVESYMKQEASK